MNNIIEDMVIIKMIAVQDGNLIWQVQPALYYGLSLCQGVGPVFKTTVEAWF